MPVPSETANRWICALALAAAAAILSKQLLAPPVVGLADNGDYQRVMTPAGFAHSTDVPGERYFVFLRTKYRRLPTALPGTFLSSETVLALVARGLGGLLGERDSFDLRLLGGVHLALLVLALGLLLRAARELSPAAQAAAAALLVVFFTDVGYAAPFNSFYAQTASLLFLFLVAGIAGEGIRRGRLGGLGVAAFFLCAAAFVASKPQEAIQAPVLALLGARLAGVRGRGAWRAPALWLAIGLVAFGAWFGRQTPIALREAAIYQVVFYEVLPHSPDPAADAAELGLDPAWLRYSGSDAFQPDSPLNDPGFRTRLLASVGYRRILVFYARHPARAAERLTRVSRKMWSLRPSYGNLEKSAARPRRPLTAEFAAWSGARLRWLGPHGLFWVVILLGGNAGFAAATYRRASPRGRLLRESLLAAAAMSATAFFVCVLTNAPPDFSRVFYVAQALCDLLIVVDASWLVQTLSVRHAARR
jgi:hypothetical protein